MGSHPPHEKSQPRKEPIVSHPTTDDVSELAEVYISAFEHPPLRQVLYRGVPRSSLVQRQAAQFKELIESQSKPSAREEQLYVLKATDPDSHEIMALIIWTYLPHGYDAAHDHQAMVSHIPAGANEKLWTDFAVQTGKLRGEHPSRREAHWLLEMLCTHPRHERRGAASKLARWAFDKADADGKQCFVDASAYGHKMYERCGFEDVGEMVVDLEKYEPGCGFEVQRWKAMVRQPGPGSAGEKVGGV